MYGFSKQKSSLGSNMMQNYMEKQMHSLHDTSAPSLTNYRDKLISFLVGIITITVLPYIHIGIVHLRIWTPQKTPVFRNNCTCSCFDTVFRGEYEEPGTTRYKHIYFNATWQTARIWLVTVLFVLLAYESIKYVIRLVRKRNTRHSMLALYFINLYPHYYSWWSYFSYYNEDFYRYFKHHMWFTLTEVITTCIVLNLMDRRNEIISWKILAVVSINLMHVLVGALDQFIADVIYGKTATFLKARNLALMGPDLLHIVIPLWELYRLARKRNLKVNEICYKEEIFLCIIFVSMGTLVGRLL